MTISQKSLDALCEGRKRWVKSTQENNFEDGIHRILSEMYPDQAHFIYELLQNAEDAKASIVNFSLEKERLVVTHDGKRLFNYEDVESITSIGDSTKRGDINQIGKFGVGFKAVFAYTNTPRVYSGSYNFEIRDLVCPFKITPFKKKNNETVFVFPFNHNGKNAVASFLEIKRVFNNISHDILLFLHHIEAIEWSIEGGGEGVVLRTVCSDIDPDLIQISITNSAESGKEKNVWFLRFQKKIPNCGDLKCGVAFKLEFRKVLEKKLKIGEKSLSKTMKVVPDHGRLCIFFPADKESTGLKFHINGPFASTIDRASIRYDDQDNIEILAQSASLFEESLDQLKLKRLITADFLAVLPNDDDDLDPFYGEFRNSIYNALKTRKLIPTQSGGFAKARDLIRGSKKFVDLFGLEDISILSGEEGKQWAVNVLQNQRSDKLLRSLGIPKWGNEELVAGMDENFHHYRVEKEASQWLIAKGAEWICDFYLLFGEADPYLPWYKIILTKDEKLVTGDNAYFPPEEETNSLGLHIVKRTFFDKIKKEKKEKLIEFLQAAGVKNIGEQEEIENILKKYYEPESPDPTIKQHKKHIQKFISWAQESGNYRLFQEYYIFFDSEKILHTAASCFLDRPFSNTGLAALQEYTELAPLWSEYSKIKDFEFFAKKVGVVAELEIQRKNIEWSHPDRRDLFKNLGAKHTHTGIDQNYTIENIEQYLKSPSIMLSRLIWATMCNARSIVLEAKYRPNQTYQMMTAPSSLVYHLMKVPWIPGRNGEFYFPQKMTQSNLPDDLVYDNRNGWLTAIKFGEEEQQSTEEFKAKKQHAEELGINPEDVDLIKKYPDDFQEFRDSLLARKSTPDFPVKSSKDPGRRKAKAADKVKNAPEKTSEQKKRNVRTSRNKIDPAPWLLTQYTNDSGQMFCQLCQHELSYASFKKRTGDYYFECVEILPNDKLSIEYEAQFLALCPLCSAKYKEFIKIDDVASDKLLDSLTDSDVLEIPLEMGDENLTLRFVETHYSDLQVALFDDLNLK